MLYDLDDAPTRKDPKIRYTFREFEGVDAPDKIRWRAFWDKGYQDGLPCGIELQCFPVVKKTPEGAWIDPFAYRYPTAILEDGSRMAWNTTTDKATWKLVYDKSNSAWAKPTRDDALKSLWVRLHRWRQRELHSIKRLNAALDVGDAIFGANMGQSKPGELVSMKIIIGGRG